MIIPKILIAAVKRSDFLMKAFASMASKIKTPKLSRDEDPMRSLSEKYSIMINVLENQKNNNQNTKYTGTKYTSV